MPEHKANTWGIPRWAMIAMVIVGGGGAMALMVGWEAFPLTAITAIVELAIAAAIAVAAGGFGYPVIARVMWHGRPAHASPAASGPTSETAVGLTGKMPVPRTPAAGLVVLTSCALGLWMLSTAMLILGSIGGAMLSAWVWRPVIAAGVLLAFWQGRRRMEKGDILLFGLRGGHNPSDANDSVAITPNMPGEPKGRMSPFWILIAIAVGIWLSGAMRPPGAIGLRQADAYDVLEYHLQVPREYYEAGKIASLHHNVYSYYPSGTEMLFLLSMCLRGGAYEGMYLATVIHGLFGAVAVAAVVSGMGGLERRRGRFAAVLLATSPAILYLSWLALVELSQLMYLTLALLWLREWLSGGLSGTGVPPVGSGVAVAAATARRAARGSQSRSMEIGALVSPASSGLCPAPREGEENHGRDAHATAACIGLMLGGACSVKYLSVGFIAIPVLAVMLIRALAAVRPHRPLFYRRLRHVAIAGAMTLVLFSPWLIRNMIATGNPVFPLATNVFGRGYLPAQEEQRWLAGHSPGNTPPVPIPQGWQASPAPSRAHMLIDNFVKDIWLGPPMLTIVIAWLIVLGPKRLGASGATPSRRPCGSTPRSDLRRCVSTAAQEIPAPGNTTACNDEAHLGTAPRRGTRGVSHAWDWALFGVLAIQVVVWAASTRGMPWRFLSPAIAEIALLAGGALAALAQARTASPGFGSTAFPGREAGPRPGKAVPPKPWPVVLAGASLGVVVLVNLWNTYSFFNEDTKMVGPTLPWSGQEIASQGSLYCAAAGLPKGSKIMLVGESQAFYFPTGAVYATAFDPNPLATAIDASKGDPPELLRRLRAAGVTHIWVNWPEIWRLAATYGFPPQLTSGLWPAAQAGRPPRIDALDPARMPGLKSENFYRGAGGAITTQPARPAMAAPARWEPFDFPPGWPMMTLYAIDK